MSPLFRRVCSTIILVMFLPACSAFRSATVPFTVTAEPQDAEISINGTPAGKGTASQAVRRDQNVEVMVRRTGCEPVQRRIGKHLSGTGVLDLVGGFFLLVPFVGLITPGAFDPDETAIAVRMPNCNQVASRKKSPAGVPAAPEESAAPKARPE